MLKAIRKKPAANNVHNGKTLDLSLPGKIQNKCLAAH